MSQLLNTTCSHIRKLGVSSRSELKEVLALADWKEGDRLEHGPARDFICDKARWSLLFRGWDSAVTLLLPRSKKVAEKTNVKAVLSSLWDAVSHMVKLARLDSTTLEQRQSFEAAALLARRCWRGLNTEGADGLAASQEWRPTVWTHVYMCHLRPCSSIL